MKPDRVVGEGGKMIPWWWGTTESVMSGRCVELREITPPPPLKERLPDVPEHPTKETAERGGVGEGLGLGLGSGSGSGPCSGRGPGDRGTHGCQGGAGRAGGLAGAVRAGANSVGYRNGVERTLWAPGTERTLWAPGTKRTLWAPGKERGSGADSVGSRNGANSFGSQNGGGSGADSVSSWNRAGSGTDSVGSRNGADSVGSWNGGSSGADSVGSRNEADSGADSVGSWNGLWNGLHPEGWTAQMQSQVDILLQRYIWSPVWHHGLKGVGQASPEDDHEADLLCSRLASHSHEVLGVILDAPVSLPDFEELPCWTHVEWFHFVTGRREKSL